MRKILVVGLTAFASLLVLSLEARAQGSITGAVKDPSGAVLPGVTVEAASPALIEQTRTAVTDSNGNYRIVDLPPGTYSVTFTLTGFKTVRREGIVIQGVFNATVSPLLEVGALEETITVTGSPTVDVSNNTAQFVVDRDILDVDPNADSQHADARAPAARHRGHDIRARPIQHERPRVEHGRHRDRHRRHARQQPVRQRPVQRLLHERCGHRGSHLHDRRRVGGNAERRPAHQQHAERRRQQFSGTFFAYGAGSGLQWDNRSDAMKSGRRRFAKQEIAYTWQVNPSFGGPIMRNKLWFYFTYKYEDFKNYVASSAFADGSRAFRQSQGNYSAVTRLTWAASSRDKIRFYLDRQFNGEDYNGFNTLPTTTPEASTDAYGLGWVPQIKWTQTTTNKLLLDAGLSYYTQDYEQSCRPEVGPRDLPRLEQTTNRLSVGLRQHDSAVHELDQVATAAARRRATSRARTRSRPA